MPSSLASFKTSSWSLQALILAICSSVKPFNSSSFMSKFPFVNYMLSRCLSQARPEKKRPDGWSGRFLYGCCCGSRTIELVRNRTIELVRRHKLCQDDAHSLRKDELRSLRRSPYSSRGTRFRRRLTFASQNYDRETWTNRGNLKRVIISIK